ncbi:MAG: hypothetical protein HDR15_02930 [Lachnospiraceae bacterium]|nr:hypothetical protein [Lachnospiraceae bacterium]
MEEKIEELRKSLLNNMPTLFLGAGFSRGAICASGIMPTGKELKKELFNKFVVDQVNEKKREQIQEYGLREMCDYIDSLIPNGKMEREKFLTERLRETRPNEKGFHKLITKYPWRRIYTVNIDDLVENIYESANKRYRSISSERDVPELGKEMELIKLHGCVRRSDEGYCFSKKEYNTLINQKLHLGLVEFTSEIYSSNDIIFIGASMDEPDLEYYLQLYEDMQIKRKSSKLFFIDPNPSVSLELWGNRLGAIIIEWDTQQFLEFVSELKYDPEKKQRARLELNRNGFFRLKDNIGLFKENYDSNIYQGFSCDWQDVFEHWTFKHNVYIKAEEELKELLKEDSKTKCFSIYGSSFSGKSTLLKQLGYYLYKHDYEVLEYSGTYFNYKVIVNYILESDFNKYVIVIDNAPFYYPVIERVLQTNFLEKEVVIICAARSYYHGKKKYYLRGNCFHEYNCEDSIKSEDAKIIYSVLDAKNSLYYLYDFRKDEKYISEIVRKKNIINLLLDLTYGREIRKKFHNEMLFIHHKISPIEEKLLLELAIFDRVDIVYYPIELFSEKYGKTIIISKSKNRDISALRISDYVRYDSQGISLRNSLYQNEIIKGKKLQIYQTVSELLLRIAPHVTEGKRDIWTIIFQSLCSQKKLKSVFDFTDEQQDGLLKMLSEKYGGISYYWLQRGLHEQSKGDYAKAFTHLKKSQAIQPRSFKIQHAIARNYLKYANSQKDFTMATSLFSEGENLMRQLIYSNEYYIKKAKAFSVSSYVLEKVRFIERFNLNVKNEELSEMRNMLDSVYVDADPYIMGAMRKFYNLLQKKGKLSLIRMSLNNPYLEIMKTGLDILEDLEEDFY